MKPARTSHAPVVFLIAIAVTALLMAALAAPAGAALPVGDPKISGKLVRELPELRTRTSNTYLDERGRYSAKVFAESVNFQRPDGAWAPIDSTLVATATGLRTRAADYRADLPSTLAAAPVKVTQDARWVSFKLQGASKKAKAKVAGSQATYPDVLTGVDAVYVAGNDQLKEDLVLASAAATATFAFELDASAGLTPQLRASGIVEFDDAAGRTHFTLGAPVMVDAAGRQSRAVSYELTRDAKGFKLTTTADRAWLKAAGRKFPVRLDPGAGVVSDPDCSLDESNPSISGCLTDSLKVGRQNGKEHRAIMRFAVRDALPRDAEIFNASVAMRLRSQTNAAIAPTRIGISRVTHSWDSGVGWDRYDGVNRWGSPGGDFAEPRINGDSDTAGGTDGLGTSYFNIGKAVTDWHTAKYPEYGLIVRDKDTAVDNLLSFDSVETVAGDDPYLVISYQRRLGERPGYKLEEFSLNDRMALKVNPATGNLLLRQTDMTIPGGLGPDTTVGRTYNLYQPGPQSPTYGQGWTMDTGAGVFLENQGNFFQQLYGPSGWGVQFDPISGPSGVEYPTSPPGIDGKLTRNAGGQHTLTMDQTQTKYVFEAVAPNVRARLLRVEDRNGRKTEFAYAGSTANLATITDNQARVTSFLYDTSNRLTRMTDPAGRQHHYTYDATSGLLATYTDPATGVTRYFYDANSRLTKVTTPGGRSTTVDYHPVGHEDAGKVKSVTRVTDLPAAGDGPTTRFEYDENRDTSSDAFVTDPLQHETRYSFDTSSRLTSATDALGNKQATTYDSRSNVQTYSAPGSTTGSANLSTNTRDSDGNLTGTATPTTSTPVGESGKAIRTAANYPAGGSVTGGTFLPSSSTDEQGKQTAFAYDAAGNTTSATQQGNAAASVSFVYSATSPGRVDKSRDGLGKETAYGYDPKGNLTSIAPPAASIAATSVSYAGHAGADQALSRVSSITRPVAGTETYDYDAQDRVTRVTYADGKEVQSTYDLDGNLTQAVDTAVGAGTRTLSYDKLNRLVTQNGPNGASYTYRYDLSSNLTSVQDTNGVTEYGYDAANRGISIYQPGIATPVKFSLDDRGNRTKTMLPNGVTTEQSFNEASQLSRTCTRPTSADTACSSSTSARLLDFAYSYRERAGALGQGPLVDGLQETVTDKDSKLTRHCYDDLNRVTRVETGTTSIAPALCTASVPGSSSSEWWTYAFDLAGNITRQQRKGSPQQTFAYADGNRLCWKFTGTSSNTCANPPAGVTTYTHESAGQQTAISGGGRSSTYNVRQQLTALTGVSSLTYFGTGQSDLTGAGGSTHRSGVLGLSQIGTDTYVRDEFGGLVSQQTAGGRQYHHTDALGSVRATTDSTGVVSARLDYDPYGQSTSTAVPGASTSRFGYAQGESISGLYHYGERYYDPGIMRWTQPDPLLNEGDLRQANRYQYAAGDPVNLSDGDGEFAFLYPAGLVAARYGLPAAGKVVGGVVRKVAPKAANYVVRDTRTGRTIGRMTSRGGTSGRPGTTRAESNVAKSNAQNGVDVATKFLGNL